MTAVQAAGRGDAVSAASGIRPFEMARDLRPVADLIADAFAQELDERGEAALREMQMMSRLGGLLSVLNLAGSDFSEIFGGFVWVENGEVVGNITVQRADKYGTRWQIANVAVAKPWRGLGISRRLMERALSHIRERGGKWAVLQVFAENSIARNLYDHLGFETVGGMTDFEAPKAQAIQSTSVLETRMTRFDSGDWQALYDLANSQCGSLAQWWRPIRRSEFQETIEEQMGGWFWYLLGRRRVVRYAVPAGGRLDAAMMLTVQRWKGPHRLQMWARPGVYGLFEEDIVAAALRELKDEPAWRVVTTIPSDHDAGSAALTRHGFTPVRTLLTMRRPISADSAQPAT